MLAAFLPLPPDPELIEDPTPSQMDLERHFTRHLGPIDDRSYQKAMWWRNLNRIMAAIGTLLIGVIVSSSRFLSLDELLLITTRSHSPSLHLACPKCSPFFQHNLASRPMMSLVMPFLSYHPRMRNAFLIKSQSRKTSLFF